MSEKNLKINKILAQAFQYHLNNNFEQAKSLYKKILNLDSNHFESIFLLGSLLVQTKDLNNAVKLLNQAIKIKPDHTDANYNLGLALTELQEFSKAAYYCQKAIQLNPHHLEAYNNLGNILKELKEFKKAKNCYQKATEIKPDFTKAQNNLGNILKEFGEFSKAMICYQKVIKIQPNNANAHYNLALLYKILGNFPKTIDSYQETLKHEPNNLIALYELSNFKENILDINLKKKIQKIMDSENCITKYRAYGNFLLSKYELKEKNYKKEFNFLVKGHLEYFKSESKKFNNGVKYWLNELPRTKELLNFNKENKPIKEASHEVRPIFVIGFPRCGSTLVEKIIASNNQHIPIGEETNVLSTFIGKKIMQKKMKSDIENIKLNLVGEYKQKGLLQKKADYIFTDKSLDNFFYLEIIKNIFPNAKIINCIRNADSSIMSLLKNNLRDVTWAHNLDHIFKFYDIYYHITNRFKKKFPNFIYDLNYDKFVSNPVEESKNLIKFCDLKWNKKCLEFYKRKDLISKTASNVQIRNAVYTNSIKKYSSYKCFLDKYGKKYFWYT